MIEIRILEKCKAIALHNKEWKLYARINMKIKLIERSRI